MRDDRLARGPALAVLAGSVGVLVVLGLLMIPWDWVPGGDVQPVRPEEILSQQQIDRAEHFASVVRRLGWSSLGVSLVVTTLLGFTSLGSRLVGAMPRRLRLPLGVLAVLVIGRLATLPFSLLIRRERLREGLTYQSFCGWLRDDLTSLAVTWVATTLGMALVVGLARRTSRWWFAWAGLGAAGLAFGLSFLYPVVVEPLFNRFTPMPDGPLRTSLLELADQEGVPVDDVLVADASRRTTTLNAYVSGYGQTRRIVVYDNLVRDAPDEVRLVVAHELGHAKYDDVLTGTALGAVGSVAGVALLALLLDWPGLRRRVAVDGPGDARVVPLVLALVAVGTLLTSPLQSSASRAIEARADRASLEATGDLQGFERLQQVLLTTSLADPTPVEWAHFWFGSHPTALQRIGLARAVVP